MEADPLVPPERILRILFGFFIRVSSVAFYKVHDIVYNETIPKKGGEP